ncbi:MAG TPA: CPBP family intramembrane glutamic endopeptidase [Candidatus Saccharimonadia bacterium]|nr:CPBP family intramembrane glutamic endopeptidase [Candidatus Saccharimonadia bacterium]
MKKLSKLFGSRSSLPIALAVVFGIWVLYRLTANFPTWVDEIFVKGLVFGIPAWAYACTIKDGHNRLGLNDKLFWKGMFSGLMLGGVYEFIGVFSYMLRGTTFQHEYLFAEPLFLGAFFLALMTAWWESLFFFGYVLNRSLDMFHKQEIPAIVMSAVVFVAFHAPLRLMINGITPQFWYGLVVLFLFAVGQGILYLRTKSIFSIILSHALWGMVLLIYTG